MEKLLAGLWLAVNDEPEESDQKAQHGDHGHRHGGGLLPGRSAWTCRREGHVSSGLTKYLTGRFVSQQLHVNISAPLILRWTHTDPENLLGLKQMMFFCSSGNVLFSESFVSGHVWRTHGSFFLVLEPVSGSKR